MKRLNMEHVREKMGKMRGKDEKKVQEQVLTEIAILMAANHPGVVRLEHFYREKNQVRGDDGRMHESENLYLVMDMAVDDIFELVQKIPGRKMDELHACYYALHIIDAMIYLHEVLSVIHRDVSNSNVLINASNGNPVVGLGWGV